MSTRRPLLTAVPPLLDRLIDENPTTCVEVHPGPREVDWAIRESIRRDLEILLSTRQRLLCPPPELTQLGRSAVEYGLPASRAAELTAPRRREEFRSMVEEAIRRSESRLCDVRVAIEADDGLSGLLRLAIDATLVDPGPAAGSIAFRAAIDSRSGRLAVGGNEA